MEYILGIIGIVGTVVFGLCTIKISNKYNNESKRYNNESKETHFKIEGLLESMEKNINNNIEISTLNSKYIREVIKTNMNIEKTISDLSNGIILQDVAKSQLNTYNNNLIASSTGYVNDINKYVTPKWIYDETFIKNDYNDTKGELYEFKVDKESGD